MENKRFIKLNSYLINRSNVYFFFLLLISYVFFNTAHLNEDAFITFRAVDNLLNGFGPVWNIGERVQVYTHPLWYYLLVGGVAIFKDSYWVSIGLSYLCLLGTFFIIVKYNNQILSTDKSYSFLVKNYLVLFVLILSRSFVDYTSSGLENPLIHLLLCLYIYLFFSEISLSKKFFWTTFIYGLIFLTRPDAIFLITTSSAYLLYKMFKEKERWFLLSIISLLPVFFWEFFSILYYGSPVPNTALAKTNIDYSFLETFKNAIYFYIVNFKNDTITLTFIVIAIVLGWLNKNKLLRLFSIGLVLQQLYIIKVGGDYMLGRFLSSSLLVAVLILLKVDFNPNYFSKIKLIIVTVIVAHFPIQASYTLFPAIFIKEGLYSHGISDARTYYYKTLGVIPVLFLHDGDYKTHNWMKDGEELKGENIRRIVPNIGMMPWTAGEKAYWVDCLALSEPFLARLPAMKNMRIGHYKRAIPDGYYCTIMTGENYIKSKKLASLYDDVSLVVHGDIWTKKRWEAIWRLNTGFYKNLEKEFDRNSDFVNKTPCENNN